MLDLETMSTESNAAICSIGAVKFNLAEGITDSFYITVDVADCKRCGLDVSLSTVKWWSKQPKSTLDALRENCVPLKDALTAFSKWYGSVPMETWGCGANFDNVIIENAYKAVGMVRPWNAWKDRCYRTVRELIKMPENERLGTYHNALDDAKHQAAHLLKILGS